jgi:hypothetical protein
MFAWFFAHISPKSRTRNSKDTSKMKSLWLSILVLLLFISPSAAQIGSDSQTSPDGRLTLNLVYNDDGPMYQIRDNVTKKSSDKIPLYTRLLYVKWTDRPDAILVIEHIAGGSLLRCLSIQKGKWAIDDVPAPVESDHSSVTSLNVNHGIAGVCYKVAKGDDYIGTCCFNYDLTSGKESNITNKAVSGRAYDSLKELGNE